ncbi:hypothetical protein B7494_g8171 [Chlorociboria aeruginascens]|nr:hypothetical protein B7494_g8171 [Chlorociboria aeruginascens]
MSAQESSQSCKRDHDESFGLEPPLYIPPHMVEQTRARERSEEMSPSAFPIPARTPKTRESSPARSTTSSLSDIGSVTPSYRQNSPVIGTAFATLNSVAPPPAKRTKLTFAEKEVKRVEKEFKITEKAKKDADKRRKEEEREAKKLVDEVEKAAREEKRRRRAEEKRRKDEDKQRLEEEKKKKERSQKTLNSFFAIPGGSRRNSLTDGAPNSSVPPSGLSGPAANSAHSTPSKQKSKDVPAYEKLFIDFFIQNNVTLAPINRFERHEEAAESTHLTIDNYLSGKRSLEIPRTFDATSLFHLADNGVAVRGKHCMPVREIMAELSGNSSRPIDLTPDSQNNQIKRTKNLLSKVPLKYLKFQEDVRPPYRGTYTSRPVNGIEKMARNPLRRDLPNTNYDYDSEAEWVEDDDAEDLNSEGEEDEEVFEDGEDMDGFLDDENDDTSNSKRLVLQGDLEPISTGLCWEDRKKRNANVKLVPYRMEIILDAKIKSIDPFSSSYWEPSPVKTVGPMEPPRLPLNIMKTTNSHINGPQSKPVTMFGVGPYNGTQKPVTPAASTNSKPKKLIPDSDMESFKKAIEGSDLSKLGLVEKLKKQFPGRPAASIKATLEMVATRVGAKEADKKWILLETASR